MDNPLGDIFDNAFDIFGSPYSLDLLPPPSRAPSPTPLQPLSDAPQLESNLMPLPPQASYSSAEKVEDAIRDWAAKYKYALIKRRSRIRNSAGWKTDVWICDRHGEPPSLEIQRHTQQPRQRRTSSRKTGCLFSINVVQVDWNSWEVRHRPGLQYQQHNHLPSRSPWSHPSHRHFSKQEVDRLAELHRASKKN